MLNIGVNIVKKLTSLFLALIMMITAVSGVSFNAQAATVSGNDIVNFAKQYDGYPYKYATHGPNSFDCSGCVHYVYSKFGIDLPVSSRDYWNNPKKYGNVVGESTLEMHRRATLFHGTATWQFTWATVKPLRPLAVSGA